MGEGIGAGGLLSACEANGPHLQMSRAFSVHQKQRFGQSATQVRGKIVDSSR